MQNATMNRAKAELELTLLQAGADAISNADLYIWLRESGIPSEVAIRLTDLIDVTKRVGDRIVSIGKIIVVKLVDFVRAHPNLSVGVAVGAIISLLISSIPLLGPILAPIALVLGVTIGAVVGHRMDSANAKNIEINAGLTQNVIEITRNFFQLLIETFQSVFNGQTADA